MDDYPEHLAPEFEQSGAVATPFDEWWARAKSSFRDVPEDVARHWLHRHWSHSPYRYLVSSNYSFSLVKWPKLANILTSWSDFKIENQGAITKGKELVNLPPRFMPYVPKYMLLNSRFPAAIVVLDNRDNHHNADYPDEHPLPAGYILIEGHTRFNVGIYLESTGKLEPQEVWLMKRK